MYVEQLLVLVPLVAFVFGAKVLDRDFGRPGLTLPVRNAADELGPDQVDEEVVWFGPVPTAPLSLRSAGSRAQHLAELSRGQF